MSDKEYYNYFAGSIVFNNWNQVLNFILDSNITGMVVLGISLINVNRPACILVVRFWCYMLQSVITATVGITSIV